LVEFVEQKEEDKFSNSIEYLASKKDVVESKSDIIKWMFIFLIDQMASLIGIIKFLM